MSSVKPSKMIQRKGYERPSCDDDLRLHLNEPRILPIPPSAYRNRDFSPPTKSILRSKSPSPKQGSPSSLRNVRFSDKDGDNDISPMFTKLHVNDACQTDDPNPCVGTQTTVATPHKPVFERTKPLPYQTRTSTPRNGSLNGAPKLEFNTPREEVIAYRALSPVRTKVHSEDTINSSATRQSRKDMFLSKKVSTSTQFHAVTISSVKSACTQTGMMHQKVPDGSRIIRNLDLSVSPRSLSPINRPVVDFDFTVESSTQTGEEMKDNYSKGTKKVSTSTQFPAVTVSSVKSACTQTGMMQQKVPDGSRIIRNLDLIANPRSLSPMTRPIIDFDSAVESSTQTGEENNEHNSKGTMTEYTRVVPNAEKILQNWERPPQERFKHDATQTDDTDNESIRSQSPDCPTREMEDTPSQFRHNSSQTGEVDAEDQSPFKHNSSQTGEEGVEKYASAFTQTAGAEDDECAENENTEENPRSVCVQTIEPDEFNDTDNERTRSIGIQAPTKLEVIPDGSRIIQNMVITHPSTEDEIPSSNSEKNGKMVTDPKWKEFVRSLDISDRSSHKDPDVHDTILVYNAEDATPHHRAKTDEVSPPNYELKPCQTLSEHSARSKLQGQAYIKREVDRIKTEVGLKPKSATFKPTVSMPSFHAFSSGSSPKPFKAWSGPEQNIVPRDVDSGLWPTDTHTTSHNAFVRRSVSPQHVLHRSLERTESESSIFRQNGRSNALTFTPIETYSFKPETVSALRSAMQPHVKRPEPVFVETVSKNTFIQGLDLGPSPPVPKTTTLLNKGLSKFTSKPSGYMAPLETNTNSSQRYGNTGRDFERASSMRHRSCSAPKASSPTSLLTTNLNKLRASVLRKYGKSYDHQRSLAKRNFRSGKSQSAEDSSVLRQSRYDSYIQCPLSNADRLLRKWATSPPSSYISPSRVNRHSLSTTSTTAINSSRRIVPQRLIASTAPVYSPRNISPQRKISPTAPRRMSPQRQVSSEKTSDIQYMYLASRENTANKRPTSREPSPIRGSIIDTKLSRSRSRSHSPIMNRKTTPTANGVKYDKTSDDNYVSMETSRSIRMPVRSSSPKQVSSKPPLPKVNKRSRSSSAERSPSGSFRVIGREPRQERREVVDASSRGTANGSPVLSNNCSSRSAANFSPVLSNHGFSRSTANKIPALSNHGSSQSTANGSPALSNNGSSRNTANGSPALSNNGSNLRDYDDYPQSGTLTIGRAPEGLDDKECVFLGHDTIQKIIEEAHL